MTILLNKIKEYNIGEVPLELLSQYQTEVKLKLLTERVLALEGKIKHLTKR